MAGVLCAAHGANDCLSMVSENCSDSKGTGLQRVAGVLCAAHGANDCFSMVSENAVIVRGLAVRG